MYILKTKLVGVGGRGRVKWNEKNKGKTMVPGLAKNPKAIWKPPLVHCRQLVLKEPKVSPSETSLSHLFSEHLETRFKSSIDHIDEKSPLEATLEYTGLFLASEQGTFPSSLKSQRNGN